MFSNLLLIAAVAMPLPIIDMHLHSNSPDSFGGAQTVCTNVGPLEAPPIDPREKMTVQKALICPEPLMSARTGEENRAGTAAHMQRRNIYGVLDATAEGLTASLAKAEQWKKSNPGRYWIALDFNDAGLPPVEEIEAAVRAGKVQIFAEISPQYDDELATDAKFESYFALAERLDIPVAIHLGEGPPGGAAVMPESKYTPAAGRPLDLDPLLARHPKLRVWVMHFGSPLVEEMIALLYSHPNLYVDIAQNNWGFPRAHFYRQLKQLVDAGFSKRIMFGSDQMIWPDTIPIAIETVESAPFLSAEQKRDILFENAARFLRISPDQRQRMLEGRPLAAGGD